MPESPYIQENVPFLEKEPLCSIEYQVTQLPYKSTSYENGGSVRLEDWLIQSGYPDDGEKLARCSQVVNHYQCEGGHDFYYRQHCGREYCPICGQKGSFYHKRRVLRAAEHFIWAIPWGNLTFTIPKSISESYLPKRYLSILQKAAWEVTRDNLGVEGAEVVIHPLGQAENGLHIHFETLFNIIGTFGRGAVPLIVLENIKKAWARKLNEIFNLNLSTTDVKYSFVTTKPKKWHKLNYIHRPVCTEDAMLKLSDQDRRYILSLKGYHKVKYFGCLANRKLHKWLRKHWAPMRIRNIPMLERKVCPICEKKMRYIGWDWVKDIPLKNVEIHNQNVWIDKAVASFLRQPQEGKAL